MPDGEPRTHASPSTPIERNDGSQWPIASETRVGVERHHPHRGLAEQRAFHCQERQFLDRIHDPKVAVELQAIDDHRLGQQVDMLRPEIAVPLDHALRAPFDQGPMITQEGALRIDHALGPCQRHAVDGHRQNIAIGSDLALDPAPIVTRPHRDGSRFRIERADQLERLAQPIPVELAARDGDVESRLGWQAPHLDQAIDNLPLTAELQLASRIDDQARRTQIDVRRETAIEADLGLAMTASSGNAGKIQERRANRLLELVRMTLGQEHPRHVGLDRFDPGGSLREAGSTPQERDLGFQRYLMPDASTGAAQASSTSVVCRISSRGRWAGVVR